MDLWPDVPARLMAHKGGKLVSLAYKYFVAPFYLVQRLRQVRPHDVVWINSVSWFNKLADTRFERALKARGAKYVLHLQDDWFSVRNYDEAARLRLPLADAVVVVTKALEDRTRQHAPACPVVMLEEPIDVERLKPPLSSAPADGLPRIAWTGNIANLKELPGAHAILAEVYARQKFVLRIVSGSTKPVIQLPIPWEWFPYSETDEASLLGHACAGLAPLMDTVYARCKDMYKIKTYLAAGVPVIASPVGHNVDVVRHGVTGYLASSKEEWTAALMGLLAQPELARAMSRQARADAEQRFSHSVLIPQWAAVLRRLFPDLVTG